MAKITFIKKAKEVGYKIYLYYVATEGPEINIQRVKNRVDIDGGHNVDPIKIEKRYYKSLELLHDAFLICDNVYFWDNSGTEATLFIHSEIMEGKVLWIAPEGGVPMFPSWWVKYFYKKMDFSKQH